MKDVNRIIVKYTRYECLDDDGALELIAEEGIQPFARCISYHKKVTSAQELHEGFRKVTGYSANGIVEYELVEDCIASQEMKQAAKNTITEHTMPQFAKDFLHSLIGDLEP